jgi:hypothetical protein
MLLQSGLEALSQRLKKAGKASAIEEEFAQVRDKPFPYV